MGVRVSFDVPPSMHASEEEEEEDDEGTRQYRKTTNTIFIAFTVSTPKPKGRAGRVTGQQ